MNKFVFRIKRLCDNKYYKSKSKFTKNGTYLSKHQLNDVLPWVIKLSNSNKYSLSISIYPIDLLLELNLNDKTSIKDIEQILNRNLNINKIINRPNEQ